MRRRGRESQPHSAGYGAPRRRRGHAYTRGPITGANRRRLLGPHRPVRPAAPRPIRRWRAYRARTSPRLSETPFQRLLALFNAFPGSDCASWRHCTASPRACQGFSPTSALVSFRRGGGPWPPRGPGAAPYAPTARPIGLLTRGHGEHGGGGWKLVVGGGSWRVAGAAFFGLRCACTALVPGALAPGLAHTGTRRAQRGWLEVGGWRVAGGRTCSLLTAHCFPPSFFRVIPCSSAVSSTGGAGAPRSKAASGRRIPKGWAHRRAPLPGFLPSFFRVVIPCLSVFIRGFCI